LSLLRQTIEADIWGGRRTHAWLIKFLALLFLRRGQRSCIAWLRLAQFFKRRGHIRLARWCVATIERRFGCYFHINAEVGPGINLPHPIGIVVGEGVKIGAGCKLYQHVTLGGRRLGDWRAGNYPQLGDHVVVFCGAAILGSVRVGDGATIGANAVVLDSVPSCQVAVGVPARVVERPGPLAEARITRCTPAPSEPRYDAAARDTTDTGLGSH